MRHFLNLIDVTPDEIRTLLREASRLKAAHQRGQGKPLLRGRVLGLVFEKPSLRTRVSFETAIAQLGGTGIFMAGHEVGIGSRESVPDIARTISQYVDAVVLRTFQQTTIETFAEYATCPVINGLSDYNHPCQALGDLLTMRELFGALAGRTIAFIGDGNNVARSLALVGALAGVQVRVAAPRGFQLEADAGAELFDDPDEAVAGADAVYTDVWVSMSDDDSEAARRREALAPFQLSDALLDLAAPHAIALHCLPAHPGEEITASVLYGDRQRIWDQAENRRHAQKALLELLVSAEQDGG